MNIRVQEQYGYRTKENNKTPKQELGKDDFLKLLMVQLQNQDPTNPVDNNAMLAQLAQFSALEQQQRTADLMEKLLISNQRNEQLTATNYIGKTVRAKGYELTKEGDTVSTLYYSSNQPIHSGKIYVYGPDGDVVYTEEIGSKQAGFYEFNWNGKTNADKDLPDGKYTVAIQAKTEDDQTILVHTEVSGQVISSVTEEGKTYLRLKDGRVVSLDNVYEVYDPSLNDKPSDGNNGNTSGGNTDSSGNNNNNNSGNGSNGSTGDNNNSGGNNNSGSTGTPPNTNP